MTGMTLASVPAANLLCCTTADFGLPLVDHRRRLDDGRQIDNATIAQRGDRF
jgi:hypothetical protein